MAVMMQASWLEALYTLEPDATLLRPLYRMHKPHCPHAQGGHQDGAGAAAGASGGGGGIAIAVGPAAADADADRCGRTEAAVQEVMRALPPRCVSV